MNEEMEDFGIDPLHVSKKELAVFLVLGGMLILGYTVGLFCSIAFPRVEIWAITAAAICIPVGVFFAYAAWERLVLPFIEKIKSKLQH